MYSHSYSFQHPHKPHIFPRPPMTAPAILSPKNSSTSGERQRGADGAGKTGWGVRQAPPAGQPQAGPRLAQRPRPERKLPILPLSVPRSATTTLLTALLYSALKIARRAPPRESRGRGGSSAPGQSPPAPGLRPRLPLPSRLRHWATASSGARRARPSRPAVYPTWPRAASVGPRGCARGGGRAGPGLLREGEREAGREAA